MKKQVASLLLGIGLIGAVAVMPASAQENNPGQGGQGQGGGGQGGGRGGRGNFDPAQWRQQAEERMKKDMGATDEEWKVLQPKIQKVQQIQFSSRFGGFGGRRGGGGGGGGGGGDRGGDNNAGGAAAQQPSNPVSTASRELRETLDNKDSTPEQIKAKLDALRAARVKAKEELTKAQTELREIASVRQEAVLVRDGILD